METRANSIYHYNETILRSSGTHFRNEIQFKILTQSYARAVNCSKGGTKPTLSTIFYFLSSRNMQIH